MSRRVHQVFEYTWEKEGPITTLQPRHADAFIAALDRDEIRKSGGGRYDGDSKRKFADALAAWFRWAGEDWEATITFTADEPRNNSNLFTRKEIESLWQASLEYKGVPAYNNLSPDERDRWKAHIAQELSKPKENVIPADWEQLNHNWKIPSLVQTTRKAGWRAAMVGRLKVEWYDEETQSVHIPRGKAVKNNDSWTQELPNDAARPLERWLSQRENIAKYDDRDEMWLNRRGNPYTSNNLNNLLDNLMEDAGISASGRKLTWHSFRHTIGTYVYHDERDLKLVAEILRQKSKSSAERYVHVPPEMKRSVAERL